MERREQLKDKKKDATMKNVMLTHLKLPKDRWQIDVDGSTVLDTGSSVVVLKCIRKLRIAIPEVLSGTDCWNTEYWLRWDSESGVWQ